MQTRILIIDDDPLICASLEIILNAQEDFHVAGAGHDGHEAVRLFDELAPDIALMDIRMPACDGLRAAEKILQAHPDARIVFLTTFSDDAYLVRALKMGARGYLVKQDVAAIAPALRSVMNGHSVLEGEILARMPFAREEGSRGNRESSADAGAGEAADSPFAPLTEREREVVRLVAEGLDNKEIAQAAYMSEGTVRNHISAILSKLHLKNRTQIAVAYYRNGAQFGYSANPASNYAHATHQTL